MQSFYQSFGHNIKTINEGFDQICEINHAQ